MKRVENLKKKLIKTQKNLWKIGWGFNIEAPGAD